MRQFATLGLASLVFLWAWTAYVSLQSWQTSSDLMAQFGAQGVWVSLGIYAGAGFDLLLALGLLSRKLRPVTLLIQMLLIAAYTLLITVMMPIYWLHPFGPISKNLPILVLTGALWSYYRQDQNY